MPGPVLSQPPPAVLSPRKPLAKKPTLRRPLSAYGQSLTPPAAPQMQQFNPENSQSIATSLIGAQNQANQANQSRYGQGLGVLTGGDTGAQGYIAQALANSQRYGQGAKREVKQQLQNDLGKTEQDAVSRGLGNTTIRNAMLDMDKRRANNAMSDINEQVANRATSLNLQQAQQSNMGSGRLADFIAGRNDVGPDMSLLSNLMMNANAAPDATKRTATIMGGDINGPIRTGASGMSMGNSGALGSGLSGGLQLGMGAASGGGSPQAQSPLYFQGGGQSIASAMAPQSQGPIASSVAPPAAPAQNQPSPGKGPCVQYNPMFHSGLSPRLPMFCQGGQSPSAVQIGGPV